jgi:phosphatidylglycerophosphate synthase
MEEWRRGLRSRPTPTSVALFVPNVIDYGRLVLVALVAAASAGGSPLLAVGLYVACFALDGMDGWVSDG